jgi:glycosyltransferase involved in cell wall biosynthesis
MVATGLGKINRGFETYIHQLGNLLVQGPAALPVEVWGSRRLPHTQYTFRGIASIGRDHPLVRRWVGSSLWRLNLERFTFLAGMLPHLLLRRPDVLYLGEYRLYCWLYKLRQLLRLNYSLALYTGGQAIPSPRLFDPRRDFIHHITDVYIEECRQFPAHRQQLLPHFLQGTFAYSAQVQAAIRQPAGHKLLVLSVGAIEKSSKRMDLLLQALAPLRDRVFPVLLGEPTADLPAICAQAEALFGPGQYHIGKVPHAELGNWYQAADAFVLASPKESFGLVLMEALYHGLPVACYRFAETEYVVQDKAWWLHSFDPQELSKELQSWLAVIAQEQPSIADSRRAFVESRYSWQVIEAAYLQMFSQLANT